MKTNELTGELKMDGIYRLTGEDSLLELAYPDEPPYNSFKLMNPSLGQVLSITKHFEHWKKRYSTGLNPFDVSIERTVETKFADISFSTDCDIHESLFGDCPFIRLTVTIEIEFNNQFIVFDEFDEDGDHVQKAVCNEHAYRFAKKFKLIPEHQTLFEEQYVLETLSRQ